MEPELVQRIEYLERQLHLVHNRNDRVEAEKAWEQSETRLGAVSLVTYFIITLVLWIIGGPNPPVHALIPTCGVILSTLSFPYLKRWWIQSYKKHKTDG